MNKSFKLLFLSIMLFTAHINIAECQILQQVKPLVFAPKIDGAEETNKKDADFDFSAEIELTPEDYEELAYDVATKHGTDAAKISEIEFHTLHDANLVQITLDFFKKHSRSNFTIPAAIKQATKSHPTRKEAAEALERNRFIIQAISKSPQESKILQLLDQIKIYEEEVLIKFMHKQDELLELEQQKAKSLYPFPNFTKYDVTVSFYNRSRQAIGAAIFSAVNLYFSLVDFAAKDGYQNKGENFQKMIAQAEANIKIWQNKNGFSIYTQEYNEEKKRFEKKLSEVNAFPHRKIIIPERYANWETTKDYTDHKNSCCEEYCDWRKQHNHEITLPAKKTTWKTHLHEARIGIQSIIPKAAQNIPSCWASLITNSVKAFQPKTVIDIKDLYDDRFKTLNSPEMLAKQKDRAVSIGRLASLGTTPILGYMGYKFYTSNKKLLDEVHRLQTTLIHINRYLKTLKSIGIAINKDPQLAQAFKHELAMIKELFTNSKTLPKKLRSLISKLMSSSFSGDSSYFFSRIGKIVTTMDEFEQHKHLLVPYFELLGKIDVHFAAASIYRENAQQSSSRVSICLPEICDNETPCIIAEKIWHPMIDQRVVVPNDIFMGTKDYQQNWIITGANAGGKTTTITALITNIYFSQNFGIACAESFVFTPFSKIISALDVTTDLANNQSLFKAEAARAKLIKEHALISDSDQLIFTAIDEPFNGTDATVAARIAGEYLKQLGACPYHMAIVTTHFPSLTKLEETSSYTNMKVGDATVHPDKHITYPFTIERGISTQNIAEAILIEQNVL